METFIILILFFCVFAFDLLPLIKNKEKKVYWIYMVLFFASFCVLILYTYHVDVPSPSPVIKQMILKMFPKLK